MTRIRPRNIDATQTDWSIYREMTRTRAGLRRQSYSGQVDRTSNIRRVYRNANVLSGDFLIRVMNTASARIVYLPTAQGKKGQRFRIEDGSGAAFTNNITVTPIGSQTISGSASVAISTNYGEVAVRSDGANWVQEGG